MSFNLNKLKLGLKCDFKLQTKPSLTFIHWACRCYVSLHSTNHCISYLHSDRHGLS